MARWIVEAVDAAGTPRMVIGRTWTAYGAGRLAGRYVAPEPIPGRPLWSTRISRVAR